MAPPRATGAGTTPRPDAPGARVIPTFPYPSRQLRAPIGYRTGARLYAPLDRAALLAAASYLQQDIIVLDASTAMPLHAIVCNSRFVPRAPGVFQACAFVNLTKRGVGACDSLSPGRSAYMLSPSRCGWETTCITWRWCT